jgi:hypothetical protein
MHRSGAAEIADNDGKPHQERLRVSRRSRQRRSDRFRLRAGRPVAAVRLLSHTTLVNLPPTSPPGTPVNVPIPDVQKAYISP